MLNASVMDKLMEKGDANAKRVKVIATTPPYYDYNWTVRPGLDPALIRKLTNAFLKLDPAIPEDKVLMDLQRASKFVPTKAGNYAGIEAAARSAGLIVARMAGAGKMAFAIHKLGLEHGNGLRAMVST